MPNKQFCRNPECNKTIPNNMNYCSEDCLRKHQEIKGKSKVENKKVVNNNDSFNIWMGQKRRKVAFSIIQELCKEIAPISFKKFCCEVAYRTGLSLRKISDDYMEILVSTNVIIVDKNIVLGLNPKAIDKMNGGIKE